MVWCGGGLCRAYDDDCEGDDPLYREFGPASVPFLAPRRMVATIFVGRCPLVSQERWRSAESVQDRGVVVVQARYGDKA